MLQIISRVMEGNTVVGYVLSDGANVVFYSKEEAWNLAKAGRIANVKAVGNSYEQGLTGTNGFELKKLKTEHISDQADVRVHVARVYNNVEQALKIKNSEHPLGIKELANYFYKQDLDKGIINKYTLHAESNSLQLEALVVQVPIRSLHNLMKYASEEERKLIKDTMQGKEYSADKLKMVFDNISKRYENSEINTDDIFYSISECTKMIPKVVGYVVRNIGPLPITYNTVTLEDHKIGTRQINPGESAALSRIESTMLMTKPTINFSLSNARMCSGRIKTDPWYSLGSCYFQLNEGVDTNKVTRVNVVSLPESEYTRFLSSEYLSDIQIALGNSKSKERFSHCGNTNSKLKDAKGMRDIMNAFTR